MKVLSYNIHKGVGTDRRYRLDRILEVIASESPDIVCLQEVDFNVRRSRFDNQPLLMARELASEESLFQLNVPRREGGYGNLILSRWPMLSSEDVGLRFRRRKNRAAQTTIVDAPTGPVRVVNWHLGLMEGERRWQTRRLLESDALPNEPVHPPTIVVGDTNDWRNSLDTLFAEEGFQQATNPVREYRSFPSYLPIASIDKAFLRGIEGAARVVRSRLAGVASDHLPLVVDLNTESA